MDVESKLTEPSAILSSSVPFWTEHKCLMTKSDAPSDVMRSSFSHVTLFLQSEHVGKARRDGNSLFHLTGHALDLGGGDRTLPLRVSGTKAIFRVSYALHRYGTCIHETKETCDIYLHVAQAMADRKRECDEG